MYTFSILPADLFLFDGEGAGDGAAQTGAQGETQQPVSGRRASGKKASPYEGVVFGRQDITTSAAGSEPSDAGTGKTDDGTTPTSDALEAKRKAFRDLVRGEYKEQYAEATQQIINRRFRETKGLEQQVSSYQPIIDMLAARYKVTDGDMAKLASAIEDDTAYWQEAADEAGMTVDQYKQLQKLQRENAQLLERQKAARDQQQAQETLERWYREAEPMKAKYPGFDLAKEVKDPQFLSLLKSGVPVEHAYKVIHMDDIVATAIQTSAQTTERQVVDNIRAKGTRARENGATSQSPFTVKDDVSKLTREDRAEIARRVARGEKISF